MIVAVYQLLMATVNLPSNNFNLATRNPWFRSFPLAATPYQENQAL